MLTKRENLLETIRGGHPDRYVNSYEPYVLIVDPIMKAIGGMPFTMKPGDTDINGWGVKVDFPLGAPGPFPMHSEELTVLKDITKWKEMVKAPKVVYSDEDWAETKAEVAKIDRNEYFVTGFIAPGIFEKVHYLMGMQEALISFYEEPEAMHELIDFLADWEISHGKEMMKHIQPDALFHHDDWGSQISSFISPEMFEEFLLPAYKKVYGYFKEQGCIIIHHSDSYGANLVPFMIEMGMDIWQGTMSTNNIPELIKKYGGQITFMGGIDNGIVDRVDWTPEKIAEVVENVCRENGTKFFIPGTTMGGPDSVYPGVYDAVTKEIDRMSKVMF
ncbi:uroporphyrinogen decarboxylase family protein [Parasporobacterium paucivorans]|uniref:Uroporphyrinogen decarboxylase (URO-D) n=1 Tax=Parasporobacterium paucivorans DSM 15970 TaxID=1122934 RepID=A0A1M6E3L9_9FIRM|nr:uroporphyrinogen decarboxylase family protein [Parasporobacterium paucivorans]SHI79848.1 Uroporphyrinogen decarboxylase (URO-D) [Parasporobacterium paucivorans DSM 15970]